MRHHFAGRIVAAVLALQKQPGKIERHYPAGLLGRQLPLQIHEFAPGLVQALAQLACVELEQARQLLELRRIDVGVGGAGPYRFHGRADGERFAVAVGNLAAMRAHLDHAAVTRCALLLQKVVVQSLQVDGPCQQSEHPREQHQQQGARAPLRQLERQYGVGGTAHLGATPGSIRLSGATSWMRAAGGTRICSCPLAIFSMRECIAQVLCSSCSWPHSISSSLASSCALCNSTNSLRALCCAVTTPSAHTMSTASSTMFSRNMRKKSRRRA